MMQLLQQSGSLLNNTQLCRNLIAIHSICGQSGHMLKLGTRNEETGNTNGNTIGNRNRNRLCIIISEAI